MRIVLMGPPGAGKGTQAARLTEALNVTHLSSGDIFRAERASGSELGDELAKYMDAGELVPDETVVNVMAKAIRESDDGGLLLDGFPRTVHQAEALDAQLAASDTPLDGVAVITADDDLIVDRITGRRVCSQCGRVYHVRNMPPKKDGVCDECGGEVIQRSDDTEPVVRERLATYYRQTEPVIDYYRRREDMQVMEFDGTRDPDVVAEDIISSLRSLTASGE